MSRSRGFFCPGIVEKFSPGSRRFAPRFFPGCAAVVCFSGAPRPIFSQATAVPFFSWCSRLSHTTICPASRARNFFPSRSATGFYLASRHNFPPAAAPPFHSWRFVPQKHPNFPASPPEFSPAAPDISPAAVRPFFSPEQSAPCSLGISPLRILIT